MHKINAQNYYKKFEVANKSAKKVLLLAKKYVFDGLFVVRNIVRT